MFRRLICVVLCCFACLARADEPTTEGSENEVASPSPATTGTSAEETASFQLSDEVRDALLPLFSSIAKADVSRATVAMSAESKMDGAVLESQTSTYQVVSLNQDQFTD